MESFRQFPAGPDPFGRTWQVRFKWLQTAISLRHSDTVDVKFLLHSDGERAGKTIAMPHKDLLALSRETGQPMTDPWCARLAALHLKHMVETGEDLEKELVTLSPEQLSEYNAILAGAPSAAAHRQFVE
jgi:hypothetical protein